DALRELAIGHGFAECDLAQCVVDRAAERLNTGQVEPDRVEIDPLACEVLPRLIDDCRNMRRRFGCVAPPRRFVALSFGPGRLKRVTPVSFHAMAAKPSFVSNT